MREAKTLRIAVDTQSTQSTQHSSSRRPESAHGCRLMALPAPKAVEARMLPRTFRATLSHRGTHSADSLEDSNQAWQMWQGAKKLTFDQESEIGGLKGSSPQVACSRLTACVALLSYFEISRGRWVGTCGKVPRGARCCQGANQGIAHRNGPVLGFSWDGGSIFSSLL